MIIGAIRSAQEGARNQAQVFAEAVRKINRATLQPEESVSPDVTSQEPVGSDLLLDGMMDMILAQRAFSANLRAAEAASEMLKEATEL